MTFSQSLLSRRRLLMLGTAAAVLSAVVPALAAEPKAGGTLTFVFRNESPTLVAINNTSGTAWTIGPKIFDALLQYGEDLTPEPQLATEWSVAPDGLRYTFKLRPGVKWHDGKDFTSEDVAFTINFLKVSHPRGRSTFAHVTAVETPDPLTAIIVLDRPAPYLLSALAATETPVIPKHIFEGTDPAAVPADNQLIGTGPFVFKEYVRGNYIILERNPNYWNAPKPYLDKIVFRFITDAAARSAAFQAGEVDLGEAGSVPLTDIERIKALPNLGVDTKTYAYSGNQYQLIFNFDNEYLKHQKVRQAIAHAIDLNLIVNTIYYGYADVSPSPVSVTLPKFVDPSIKPYAVDLDLANKLLDEAGFPRKDGGDRFALRLVYNPSQDKRLSEYFRQALKSIGIDAPVAAYDFATYVKTVYTDRAFDLTSENLNNAFDPTVGVQRVYWSKNFKIGLPFSNSAHYANPEVDRLLEAAGEEPDAAKRQQLFFDFQKIVAEDLPALNTVAPRDVVVYNRRVKDFALGAEGLRRNFADVYLES
jgi:peptide/nickel transport system substrate-binding protein